jgi:hypothetical protein
MVELPAMNANTMKTMDEMLRILMHGSETEREAMCRDIDANLASRQAKEKGR